MFKFLRTLSMEFSMDYGLLFRIKFLFSAKQWLEDITLNKGNQLKKENTTWSLSHKEAEIDLSVQLLAFGSAGLRGVTWGWTTDIRRCLSRKSKLCEDVQGGKGLCSPEEHLISMWQRGHNEFPANTQRREREGERERSAKILKVSSQKQKADINNLWKRPLYDHLVSILLQGKRKCDV